MNAEDVTAGAISEDDAIEGRIAGPGGAGRGRRQIGSLHLGVDGEILQLQAGRVAEVDGLARAVEAERLAAEARLRSAGGVGDGAR